MKGLFLCAAVILVAAGIAVAAALTFWTPAAAAQLNVGVTDYGIAMPTTLHAGHLEITLDNHGVQDHELLLFRTDLPATALPVDASGDVIEDSPLLQNVLDSGAGLPAHGTQALSATLRPGHYVAVCNLPGHYRLGMRLDLTVTK